ncbi:UDP-glucose/GDP-mannose dehydrogenase family protein [Psychrobacter pygoscelis]|uniref:UDP-glucose/GDP-mannose dehydrogenase family protein n=1 Tax=Psychrobacter pygoscelis TaxID=2488563 RepID=UPI001F6116B3|nr:UDP-glucose/GDP-mannose dehydrogenase family protein [Psychrobacter pygoscelis]
MSASDLSSPSISIQEINKVAKPPAVSMAGMSSCVIVGHSIDAVTTATVLASLEQTVYLYVDESALQHTLATYTFEHQLQALWQLYISQTQIVLCPVPSSASELFSQLKTNPDSEFKPKPLVRSLEADLGSISADLSNKTALFWLFYSELPSSWTQKTGGTDDWIIQFNKASKTPAPLILSGIDVLGKFASIARECNYPWVYYVPFVFLQDGKAYASMLSPKLWLMGEKTPKSTHKIAILQPLLSQAQQTFITDIATTEFARSAIMNMLATRVSFMNEWSRLADHQQIDITEVAMIMGLDERIGKSYLKAGWGFGGQTLPAEINALQQTLSEARVENRLMHAVDQINDDQKELIFRKFWQYFDGCIEGKTVSIWGGSYKEGSGRTSASAIHPLLNLLWSYDITTQVYAGEAQGELLSLYSEQPLLQFIAQPETGLSQSQALFILTWTPYQQVPISTINDGALPVFDAQNALTNSQIDMLIGDYIGIGRGK